MPGSMAPLKKRRNSTRLPLALNPLKSKDVLAVLAERNQAIVPVGAWVEPASPHSSEIPASVSVSSPPWRGPHPTCFVWASPVRRQSSLRMPVPCCHE